MGAAKDQTDRRTKIEDTESTIKKRGADDRHMIDYHLTGRNLLYFERMKGNLRETRENISERLGVKHVVKSVYFLVENDNKITEVCATENYASWFAHLGEGITYKDRVLDYSMQIETRSYPDAKISKRYI